MRFLVGFLSILGTALRGLLANRSRALLSTSGIAIGVATLMAIYALTQGLTQSFTDQLSALGSGTLYVSRRPFMMRGDWWKYRNRPRITSQELRALRDQGTLFTAVAPMSFGASDVSVGGVTMSAVNVRGTNEDFPDTANIKVESGRFLTAIDTELGANVAVIGSEVKDRLFNRQDPVGKKITVRDQRFTVIGVLKAQGKVFGQSQDNIVFMPLGSFGRMFGYRRDLMIAVAADPAHLKEAEEQVVEIMRRVRGLASHEEDTFAVNKQSEMVRMFEENMSNLYMVALLVGIITLVVGAIGVMNIMLVAVTERTREIGVRRALGAKRRTILMQFIFESALVTIFGGVLGIVIGLGGAEILEILIDLPAKASMQAAIIGLTVSGVVGLLAGLWPALRASSLDPIESLRYE